MYVYVYIIYYDIYIYIYKKVYVYIQIWAGKPGKIKKSTAFLISHREPEQSRGTDAWNSWTEDRSVPALVGCQSGIPAGLKLGFGFIRGQGSQVG